jgi:hypothetical protein
MGLIGAMKVIEIVILEEQISQFPIKVFSKNEGGGSPKHSNWNPGSFRELQDGSE